VQPAAAPFLFPSFVAQHSITFDPDDDADLIEIELPIALTNAVRKRRTEYRAGRFCARMALGACAPRLATAPIPIGPRGEPLWPPGIVGAITHTHGFASAAVALTRDARAIGLDAERFVDHDVGEIGEQVAAPAEVDALVHFTGWTTASVVGVVFSAKETLFKCLSSEVGRYFDFRDVVVRAIDPGGGTFSADLAVPLTPRLVAGMRFEGRFERRGEWVWTAMVLP
jgi:enterobactin synthetase component D